MAVIKMIKNDKCQWASRKKMPLGIQSGVVVLENTLAVS